MRRRALDSESATATDVGPQNSNIAAGFLLVKPATHQADGKDGSVLNRQFRPGRTAAKLRY
jgi:hypothetical protein